MNDNIYSLERIVHDLREQRINEAKSYRLWQAARKASNKRSK